MQSDVRGSIAPTKANHRRVLLRKDGVAPATTFSYTELPEPLATELKSRADKIRHGLSRHAAEVIRVGAELRAAKGKLAHGTFLAWAECEFGISARAAQLYMRASQWIESKSEKFSRLPISTIYLLASATTPPEVADEFTQQIDTGARITYSAVRQRIDEARSTRRCRPADPAEGGEELCSRLVNAVDIVPLKEAVAILTRLPGDVARLRKILLAAGVSGLLGPFGHELVESLC